MRVLRLHPETLLHPPAAPEVSDDASLSSPEGATSHPRVSRDHNINRSIRGEGGGGGGMSAPRHGVGADPNICLPPDVWNQVKAKGIKELLKLFFKYEQINITAMSHCWALF